MSKRIIHYDLKTFMLPNTNWVPSNSTSNHNLVTTKRKKEAKNNQIWNEKSWTTHIKNTLFPKLSRTQFEKARQLLVRKIHNTLGLQGIQTAFLGTKAGSHRLILGQVIEETAPLTPAWNWISVLSRYNPTSGRGGGGDGLSERSRKSGIGGVSFSLGFGNELLLGFGKTLVLPISVRHFDLGRVSSSLPGRRAMSPMLWFIWLIGFTGFLDLFLQAPFTLFLYSFPSLMHLSFTSAPRVNGWKAKLILSFFFNI